MSEEKLKKEALEAITAWRQLNALKLLKDKESLLIKERIMIFYGKYLNPLRNTK